MKKSFVVTGAFILLALVSLKFTERMDDPKYKNLKILPKDITHEQMDSVMHHFSSSLSVKCNFCHVRNEEAKTWDWASDANKHKLVAREMMRMTNKINDKYFDLAGSNKNLEAKLMVTCYTCHNGKKEPMTIPPKREETPRPQPQTK